jgi:hypothetical protein
MNMHNVPIGYKIFGGIIGLYLLSQVSTVAFVAVFGVLVAVIMFIIISD